MAADFSFPSVGVSSINMRLVSATSVSSSPFTFNQQVYEHQGVRWEAEVSFPPMSHNDAKAMAGFLAGLRGQSKTFTFGNPLHNTTAAGFITGSVGATSVTANFAGAAVGDHFQHGDYLYIITSQSGSNYGIMPPLRTSAATSTVDFTYPVGKWRLASNEVNWSINEASIYGFTLAIVEAL